MPPPPYSRNPHVAQHEQAECSDCHKAHRASSNACSECHNDTPIPDGWVTASKSKNYVRELESLNK
ncbi:cytochrome c3 family protein [Slackia exigua]|uniref:cytochrome c3 family protein n=1 Tax=Slackia exigua TaxID=84109 RepID=UPI0028D34AF4|nr:cytochrome c3 family protein [Slackia exigua]